MDLIREAQEIFDSCLKDFEAIEVPKDGYSSFRYPKWFPLMDFTVDRYEAKGYGHLFRMHTKTKMGMTLLTLSFMPDEGTDVPFLLIDLMTLGKKNTVFIEYYDCRKEKNEISSLDAVRKQYDHIPDYPEKDHWYVHERSPYSLIKSSGKEGVKELRDMLKDSVKEYTKAAKDAGHKEENLKGLFLFRKRMIEEGNPSSSTLNKVFGEEGAKDFFKTCVMPGKEKE